MKSDSNNTSGQSRLSLVAFQRLPTFVPCGNCHLPCTVLAFSRLALAVSGVPGSKNGGQQNAQNKSFCASADQPRVPPLSVVQPRVDVFPRGRCFRHKIGTLLRQFLEFFLHVMGGVLEDLLANLRGIQDGGFVIVQIGSRSAHTSLGTVLMTVPFQLSGRPNLRRCAGSWLSSFTVRLHSIELNFGLWNSRYKYFIMWTFQPYGFTSRRRSPHTGRGCFHTR